MKPALAEFDNGAPAAQSSDVGIVRAKRALAALTRPRSWRDLTHPACPLCETRIGRDSCHHLFAWSEWIQGTRTHGYWEHRKTCLVAAVPSASGLDVTICPSGAIGAAPVRLLLKENPNPHLTFEAALRELDIPVLSDSSYCVGVLAQLGTFRRYYFSPVPERADPQIRCLFNLPLTPQE